jgi:hypothetical protein
MLLRHAKDALDQAGVPDGDLNVGLVAESRRWVDRITLHKDATHRVERDRSRLFKVFVKVIYDRAVEMPLQQVAAALVLREVGVMKLRALRVGSAEAVIGGFQSVHGVVGHEIEAVPKVDDRADDKRLIELLTLHRFICPLETSDRVRFLEIDPGTKPIIFVDAGP